jgi:UDP-N-acetylglucosamine/UDP-N-acetylgalactosamine diphosphorylase
MDIPPTLHASLTSHGQLHAIRHWDSLSEAERRQLIADLDQIDFELIHRLSSQGSTGTTQDGLVERALSPQQLVRRPAGDADQAGWRKAAEIGQELLKAGRVGAILVAGGQGTRLGFDKPKGMFPIGPVSGKSLYQWFAEQSLARTRQFGPAIPYFIMTSDATHADTVAYFEEHSHFGLSKDNVFFFQQGTLPAVELDSSRILLDQKGRLSLSPDGHGGLVNALSTHGLLDEMCRRGVDFLYYHQVDNPTAVFADPALLGWHVIRESELTTKVVAKVSPDERMGVVCSVDGRTEIIEYSDLTPEQCRLKTADGSPIFWAGNTAIHVFNRDFLIRLTQEGTELPYHVAKKAVPFIDASGNRVKPDTPNARKFEQFIFDALPLARNALVVEADRPREFNPVKNRDGADSPETSRAALIANHHQWLRTAGANLAQGVTVEVSPLFALDAEEMVRRLSPGTRFDRDTVLEPDRT